MRIRLTRKLSQSLNGVDLSRQSVGDWIDLPRRDAELLVAEGWALPATDDNFEEEPARKGANAAARSKERS
jgi:hypothetical protein